MLAVIFIVVLSSFLSTFLASFVSSFLSAFLSSFLPSFLPYIAFRRSGVNKQTHVRDRRWYNVLIFV